MKKKFLNYKLSLLLKKLGYRGKCYGYYCPVAYPTNFVLCDKLEDVNETVYNINYSDRHNFVKEDYNKLGFVSSPFVMDIYPIKNLFKKVCKKFLT